MAYLPNIPQPNDQLRNSQGDLLGNFQAIETFLTVNHENFASGDAGKHKFVELTNQTVIPPFGATETGFYNKISVTTNKNETFVHVNRNNNTSDNVPMTASFLGTVPPLPGADGWAYLPSGLIIKWFTFSTAPGFPGPVSVNIPFGGNMGPGFFFTLSVQLTVAEVANPANDVDLAVRFAGVTGANQFNAYFSRRTNTGPASGSAKALVIGA